MNKKVVNEKILQEQQAIGEIYKQYIDTFQETSQIRQKTFVKSETLYAPQKKGKSLNEISSGQLYTPKPIIIKCKKLAQPSSCPPPPHWRSKHEKADKKSNLKSLGDELKQLQHERHQTKDAKLQKMDPIIVSNNSANYENDYSNSTNLFVSNLSPHLTEAHLIEQFGVYGPLASVKIMWPRKNEATRCVNCGFVAFMSRSDAKSALAALRSSDDMRIDWGKPVKLPPFPVHIPAALYKLHAPPPPSGLPFNAQGKREQQHLAHTVVRVTMPIDVHQLALIHRMVEFVVREGPAFEALIMKVEHANPDYGFLRDFDSPGHVYYRWKLFSILHGDSKTFWRMTPFRMYVDGSVWVPPEALNFAKGMPKSLLFPAKDQLKKGQVDALVDLIRGLTMSRASVREAMVFCMKLTPNLHEVLDLLFESLTDHKTCPFKKIARLYLLSDLLINCKFKQNLILEDGKVLDGVCDVFRHLNAVYERLRDVRDKECLKVRVLKVVLAWNSLKLFEYRFVHQLESLFLFGVESGNMKRDQGSKFVDIFSSCSSSLRTMPKKVRF